jgi:hypothetical protein
MKKSQAEVFGIAVSVALIIFVALIFITFQMKSKPSTITKEVTYNKMAWDFVNVLVKTSTPCDGISVQNLLIDAASSNSIKCEQEGSRVTSQKYSYDAVKKILDSSLGARGEEYNLSVIYSDYALLNIISSDKIESCRNINYATVPISAGAEKNIDVSMRLCVD